MSRSPAPATIADEDLGSADLIALPAETWRAIRDRAEQLLTAAEVDGLPGAVAWLTARRLSWWWATPVGLPLGLAQQAAVP